MANKNGIYIRRKPEDTEHPFIFNHRHGTLTIHAIDGKTAIAEANKIARGLPLMPAFQVEA